ncbi:hypothetical protein EG68_10850 [Paragonimus skrjabini miyazakii]|uniref:Uncharacterized protein n=1 Tax=Paragonimus skrjabini miyazakii TaxID=59628 RepID=A0A8S9YI57_9TREM|nr:hypothetical protein EG68_10850 [Paragonimus skrjabini miyazakii]
MSHLLMVDLDADKQQSFSSVISEDEAYGITEEFLLNSLLLYALRKRFLKAADAVLPLFRQCGFEAPALAKWCLVTMHGPPDPSSQSVLDQASEELYTSKTHCKWLDTLIPIGSELLSNLDQSAESFRQPLMDYLAKARRLVCFYCGVFAKQNVICLCQPFS